ncbi:MAG: hypothetical protein COV74_07720 [Candidatus Omnitrophica bacterium CG11_big_fil_rev_8_21_14_0_20_45_26]|uniref:LPS export ABC transporter permease LptG n=1 Tax=Candidatus Abzuiibacterium crystallinum TaxID=1974748 RepID=A0A2H0LMN7_9BACT|nr:MAG: hypothetical protein COV74_07720 [Candidatus Omnitrophica bacterium CG11_big_fil_rev_8_21_14_0_20_45_26]PIW65218.1 MAG: hypothetical protein COW12_03325 [Candidatus Omnitrophica bacterium CG12_big_fil_rev_8_21_14_0_65_45_16]
MKILDRYLIKYFLIPTLFCAVMLIFLVLVADVFDNLDEFLRNQVTVRQALRYYLNLTPFVFVQVIQWATLLGTLYLLVQLNVHNELTAMKVSGLEIAMIVRPLVFVGFLMAIFTFLVRDQLVPPTYKQAMRIQAERIEKKQKKEDRKVYMDITYYGSGNRLYYAKTFNVADDEMRDFIILWLDQNKTTRKKVMARTAHWNGSLWILKQVNEFEMSSTGQMVAQPNSYDQKIYPEITETPEDFYRAAADTNYISYKDLKQYVNRLKENGLILSSELVDLQERLASPWHSLIIMFICIPLLAKTATRKSIASSILACLGIVFMFHVSTAVLMALGKSGKVYPFVSTWANNFLFGFIALFFLDRADH